MSSMDTKLHFIEEKIEDIYLFKNRFKTIEGLLNDKMGFDATLMALLQIGETLHRLKDSPNASELPIKGAYDVRNFIAHDYEGVNKAIVEDIIRNHLPDLRLKIKNILEKTKKKG